MAVMTINSDEYFKLPVFLQDYASYLLAIKGTSNKTVCEYLLDLRTFFRFVDMRKNRKQLSLEEFEKTEISHMTIEDADRVTPQIIIDFLVYAGYDRKNQPRTRMRKLSSIKSFYHYAYGKRSLVSRNPTTEIEAPKKGTTIPKYMTAEEAVRLLKTVRTDTESPTVQRDYSIIALFLNTGMRLSELVGLNLQSFDPELSSVKVIGKGNKERVIYLNKAAQDAVSSYLRIRLDPKHIRTSDSAFFLSARQTRISAKTVQWMVKKYLNMAGLGTKGLSVHKLRHTAATLMYQSGKVDIRVLKDILGHEQLNTTQIYTHVVSRNLEEAMDNHPLSDVIIKK